MMPPVPSASYLAEGVVITSTLLIWSAGICFSASAMLLAEMVLGRLLMSTRMFWEPRVDLIEDATSITLAPTGGATRGLVFYPGARVEALAYVPLLSRVAQEGTVVVVLKEPLGISLLQPGQARSALEAHPGIGRWVAGGHSLGGVAASAFASGNDAVHGLLLWASYPLDDLSASGLDVLSVSGSQDRLTTPADVGASRNSLPAGARFTEISGAVHAFFGDYGDQPGDGVARTDRRDAQDGIVEATNEFLAH